MNGAGVRAFALAAAVLCAPALGATRIDFNQGWAFRIDPAQAGEASGWARNMPADTRSVSVPHTWNIGEFHDYMGVAWYFRRFAMPPVQPGTHVELHFGATFYKARVWLNGTELGVHEGGFTAYSFDISPDLQDQNLLVVRIDNRPDADSIPGYGARGSPEAWYDWWAYGGIVRDVWLTETGSAWIRSQRIRSELTSDHATVHDLVSLKRGARHGLRCGQSCRCERRPACQICRGESRRGGIAHPVAAEAMEHRSPRYVSHGC
jgi:beta-glucuronidase